MTEPSETLPSCAHQRVLHKTSEFIVIVFYILAWILQRYVPLEMKISGYVRVVGCLWSLGGAGLIRWVHVEMDRHSQRHEPGFPTTKLIQSGPFRWSRNPTYTAFVFFIIPGSGFLLQNMWILWLWPLSGIAFYYIMIREEEDYLNQRFGAQWRNYCQKTRRWI